MQRRNFIRSAIGVGIVTTVAGCSGATAEETPPRRSNVIADISLSDNNTTIVIKPEPKGDRWVQSQREIDEEERPYSGDRTREETNNPSENTTTNGSAASISAVLSGLSPVGVASAAKGRGATGRGSIGGSSGYKSAPKTSGGRARLYGGAYVGTYYNDHEDDIDQYPVEVTTLGVGYIGGEEQFAEQDPGPGPINWDERINDNIEGEIDVNAVDVNTGVVSGDGELEDGWYRVGTNIAVPKDDENGVVDMGWEAIDFKVETEGGEKQITERWKVSPRL
jgi:hypothetical protein